MESRLFRSILLRALLTIACLAAGPLLHAQLPSPVSNAAGVQMAVDAEDRDPALAVTVPDGPPDARSFKILLPEHLTLRAHGQTDAPHLYVFQPGARGTAPPWKRVGNSLEYEADYGQIHFLARATLVNDGILFHYEFVNHSATAYDMITAITDPRFHAVFYDPRLERTYVHLKSGFDLLASDTPERLTMPLSQWFPVRYLASYSAPVPTELVQRPGDGITYRYKSRAVDVPMIATLSEDRTWVAASFSRAPFNVWSNPELTCQHVDPQVPLAANGHAEYEMKVLIFQGSLEDALAKVTKQRGLLK